MASKFQYDENGGTFFLFLLAFLAMVVLPCTYYLWPRKSKENPDEEKKKCQCSPCRDKFARLKEIAPMTKTKNMIIRILIVLGWIAMFACAYKVAHLEDTWKKWDPYEILKLDPGATTSEIKKAYRKLAAIHHPDMKTGDEAEFREIARAYKALSNEESRKNWETYGDPDGPGAMSFGIALPSWIVEKENSIWVLGAYMLVFMVGLPTAVGMWWYRSAKYGEDLEVLLDTTQLYFFFINKTSLMPLRRVVMIVAASMDFESSRNPDMKMRPSDNEEIPQLIKKIEDFGEKNREAPLNYEYSIKARALLYAHLLRLPLSEGAAKDMRYIIRKCPVLLSEFVSCTSQLVMLALSGRIQRLPKLETLENAIKLCQLVVQALWENRNPLLQIPYIGEEHLRLFSNKKCHIKSIDQLRQLTETKRRDLLRFLDDAKYQNVIKCLESMPSVEIKYKLEVIDDEDPETITADSLVTMTVTMRRRKPEEVLNRSEEELVDDKEEEKPKITSWMKKPQKKSGGKKKAKAKKPTNFRLIHRADPEEGSEDDAEPDKENRVQENGVESTDGVESQASQKEESEDGGKAETGDSQVRKRKKTERKKHDDQGDKAEQDEGSDDASNHSDGDQVNNDDEKDGSDDEALHFDQDKKKKKKIMDKIPKISHPVHAPYFPSDKQEFWWLYLVDKKQQQLMTVPFLMTNLVDEEDAILKFTAPRKPGSYHLTLHVKSDSYVTDFDKQVDLKFDVKPAKPVVESHPQWDALDEESEVEVEDSAVEDSDLCSDDDLDSDNDNAN
ncbi:translocation protein SEC63 homolog [Galendromus occidentalis]|uniref:Translocation protein SEC63 homolog n=1 Tax=Galendromus occidentalis TaxID=34638 RepID=A0AAJ6QST4_9ACAR|nr:translocation protein SEC63 homolog [Galendromus occidentalis]